MEATEKITEYIQKKPDWKGEIMQKIRDLILETEPNIQEEWKWNSPVWSMNGMVDGVNTSYASELDKVFKIPDGGRATISIGGKVNLDFYKVFGKITQTVGSWFDRAGWVDPAGHGSAFIKLGETNKCFK